jgi:predicted nucleotidyltransferase
MIYTLEQIKEIVEPIAIKYKLKAVWVFGSYARGEATEESDVDLLMDDSDSTIIGLLDLSRINRELEESIKLKVDLISTGGLYFPRHVREMPQFVQEVTQERILIYEKQRY